MYHKFCFLFVVIVCLRASTLNQWACATRAGFNISTMACMNNNVGFVSRCSHLQAGYRVSELNCYPQNWYASRQTDRDRK